MNISRTTWIILGVVAAVALLTLKRSAKATTTTTTATASTTTSSSGGTSVPSWLSGSAGYAWNETKNSLSTEALSTGGASILPGYDTVKGALEKLNPFNW